MITKIRTGGKDYYMVRKPHIFIAAAIIYTIGFIAGYFSYVFPF